MVGDTAIHHFDISTRNRRRGQHVEVAERNRLKIMTTISSLREYKKWKWKSPMETQTMTRFIATENEAARNNLKFNYLRLVIHRVGLNLGRKREKLISQKDPRISSVTEKAEEYVLNIPNKCSILGDEVDDVEETDDQSNKTVMEAALKVGGKATGNTMNKLSQDTKT